MCTRSARCRPCPLARRRLGSRCGRCRAPTRFVRAASARGQSSAPRDRPAPSGSSARSSRSSRSGPSGSWMRPTPSRHAHRQSSASRDHARGGRHRSCLRSRRGGRTPPGAVWAIKLWRPFRPVRGSASTSAASAVRPSASSSSRKASSPASEVTVVPWNSSFNRRSKATRSPSPAASPPFEAPDFQMVSSSFPAPFWYTRTSPRRHRPHRGCPPFALSGS